MITYSFVFQKQMRTAPLSVYKLHLVPQEERERRKFVMEENNKFSVRVERAFGSLPAVGGGAWSLSDGEMERREWIRKKGGLKPEDYDGEAWDIRYDVEAWDMQTSINEVLNPNI